MAFVRSPSFFSYCLLRPPSRRSADCIEAVRLLLHLRWLAAVLVVLLGSGWKSCSASASAPVACCCYSSSRYFVLIRLFEKKYYKSFYFLW
nr:uncharacterized protein LOC109762818 isoform X1 [Aegilops tauschii subsp. strangulata]